MSFSSSRSNLWWHLHTPQAPEPLRASTHEHPYILPLWMCGSQVDVRFIVSGVRHTVMKHVVVLEHQRSTLQVRRLVPFNDSGGVRRRNWPKSNITHTPMYALVSLSFFLCTEHLLSRTIPPPTPSCALQSTLSSASLFLKDMGRSPVAPSQVLIQVHANLNSNLNTLSESLSGHSVRGLITIRMPVGHLSGRCGGDGRSFCG